MTVYKFIFHVCALIKLLILKLIYGKKIKIGKRVTWRRRFNIMIANNATVSIGDDCFFNNDCSVNALNSISIGSGCIFGENVKIYDHNHKFNDFDMPLKQQAFSIGNVSIGRNCWIGSNVVILKGASIGNHCVIGAGCVVSGEIADCNILKRESNNNIEPIKYKSI